MCMCIQRGLEVNHLDSDKEFPNGKLERTVYMELPKRLSDRSGEKVRIVKLNRLLPVLKDAERTWNKISFDDFKKTRMRELQIVSCAFQKRDLILVCHVEDLIFRTNQTVINEFQKNRQSFEN